MSYKVYWHVPHEILYLELEGNLTLDDFQRINQAILDLLGSETLDHPVTLLVDITRPASTPRDFDQMRTSQTYLKRFDVKSILVAGSNKLMRLMMSLTFNLCRPRLRFFVDVGVALKVAQINDGAAADSGTRPSTLDAA